MSTFPLRHLSIRVPWHDSGWTGTVCGAPQLNGACAKLKRIAGSKDDDGAPLLVTTDDSAQNGLDMAKVKQLIAEVCGG